MGLAFYTMDRLREIAKSVVRSHPVTSDANTAPGSDFTLMIDVASVLFQGAQVAAQHAFEQIFPATADANNRERALGEYGIDFTKPATKARGYLSVGNADTSLYNHQLKAGTTFEFPGSAFPDGVARTYVALEDATFRDVADHWSTETAGIGNSHLKLRTRTKSLRRGDFVVCSPSGHMAVSVVRSVDVASRHVDLFFPMSMHVDDGSSLLEDTGRMLVKVEALTAGAAGNGTGFTLALPGGASGLHTIVSSDEDINCGTVLEMSGGADELGEIDPDTERVVRILEDTIAGAPSNGNPQHWREIALACPDVAIDDAIVYTGVRGLGTIDIVVVGHSGQGRASGLDAVNVGHLGFNRRRIGETQAEIVERWCKFTPEGAPRTHYFDDVKVRTVEWDYRGRSSNFSSSRAFLRSSNSFVVNIVPLSGYGPDCGASFTALPYTLGPDETRFTRLYPAASTARVNQSLRVGHRVNVVITAFGSPTTCPFATVVTTIVGFDYDRRYAVVADLTPIARLVSPLAADATISQWGSAGPLDQAVDDAVHAYFDGLGPGSYTSAPIDPGAQQSYVFSGVVPRPFSGLQIDRWPDEGRRWSGALRKSALLAKIHAIRGVKSATVVTTSGGQLIDMDAAPLQTLRLAGVITQVSQ